MNNGDWQVVATVLFGVVAPFIVQFLRFLNEKYGLVVKGTIAQLVALVVSGLLGVIITVITGDLVWSGDLVETGTVVFAVSAFVYQLFKSRFDNWLPSKRELTG